MTRVPTNFVDICLIYRADEPGKWVAHSLNTDQIALGDCMLEAFVHLRPVVMAYIEAAEADSDIPFLNPAPKEIRDRLASAKPLSNDLLARAEDIVRRHGKGEIKRPPKVASAAMTLELVHT